MEESFADFLQAVEDNQKVIKVMLKTSRAEGQLSLDKSGSGLDGGIFDAIDPKKDDRLDENGKYHMIPNTVKLQYNGLDFDQQQNVHHFRVVH